MGFSSPFGNLVYFVSSRPPLVVFTACLATFALTTYSLAYYITRCENVFNPDLLDWNNFMSHLVELRLCLNGANESDSDMLPQSSELSNFTSLILEDKINNSQKLLPLALLNKKPEPKDSIGGDAVIVSVEIIMSLILVEGLSDTFQNLSAIRGVIQGRQLQLNAPGEEDASLGIMLQGGVRGLWGEGAVCLTLKGPQHLLPFPSLRRKCHQQHSGAHSTSMEGSMGVAMFTVLGTARRESDGSVCGAGAAVAHMGYTPDSDLSYLTARGHLLINLRLLHTSYFLFVLVLTMACYALIRGRLSQKEGLADDMVIGDL